MGLLCVCIVSGDRDPLNLHFFCDDYLFVRLLILFYDCFSPVVPHYLKNGDRIEKNKILEVLSLQEMHRVVFKYEEQW